MAEVGRMEEDLGYVREVVHRAESAGVPRAIWILWAVLGGVGFALIDFRPAWVPRFWAIAGPLGFVLSAWLGWRHGRLLGQESWREGRLHLLHWGAMATSIVLLVVLRATGGLTYDSLPKTILLVLALAYFLGGLHLVPALKWVGLAMAAGYLTVVFIQGYVWTIVGALLAVALVITAHASGDVRGSTREL